MAAATVAYVYPSTSAPTAAVSAKVNKVTADVTWAAAADTAVAIVHNLNLPNATGLLDKPEVSWVPISMGAGSFCPTIAFTDANTLTIDKNSTAANTTGVIRFTIRRPMSITE